MLAAMLSVVVWRENHALPVCAFPNGKERKIEWLRRLLMKYRIRTMVWIVLVLLLLGLAPKSAVGQTPKEAPSSVRERLLMDFGWRFALGHATDFRKDFLHTSTFFFFGKAGYGDGPASPRFDDRAWRVVNLPHDWAVELPFDSNTNGNHGSKAIGRNFPQNDVGWYRKTFTIPESDLGRRIGVEFDGVYRDSVVWINGHYLGTEHSGYSSFHYDLTDYLNYGGTNVLAVRADATIEEGWFYEGAGIYRHVWMTKTAPLHVAHDGTFVTSEIAGNTAQITAKVTVANDETSEATFSIDQTILNADGKTIGSAHGESVTLKPGDSGDFSSEMQVQDPELWSLERPYLHKLVTIVRRGSTVADRYETTFGMRTIHFDPNQGFFLNGKHVEIKGTNNHQDHAGVGNAVPDSLLEYRIARLKEMGANAYRTSHNPPTPELLDICDRVGMLVLDEHRMMGTTPEIVDQLKRLVLRDRNHPSVILWSVGNEEWALEWSVTGERLTAAMQAIVKRLDPTRRVTVAMSGSGAGNSLATDVFGFNYYVQNDIDKMHAKFPDRPIVGTEEASSGSSRGIYVEDREHQHLSAYFRNGDAHHASLEESWNFHISRPYSAGMFYWTGFDYRGEPTPFDWPAISSQFGMMDTCGFFKDNAYLVQSWWTEKPMVHLMPHWNWPGMEGQEIEVRAYSNADEVELLLNGQSLGRKLMLKNSHLEWNVKYQPGTLEARGYKDGKEVARDTVATTTEAATIQLIPHQPQIKADGEAVSIITVRVNDAKGRLAPTADNTISFTLRGPGRILGVGNGDPSSHEPDQYLEKVSSMPIVNWRLHIVDDARNRPEVAAGFDDSGWKKAADRGWQDPVPPPQTQPNVYRGSFELPELASDARLTLILRSVGDPQSIYINGEPLGQELRWDKIGYEFELNRAVLRPGKNVVAIVATPVRSGLGEEQSFRWGEFGPGAIQVVVPGSQWKRSVFNGLAQVIVQSTQQAGEITLTATSQGLAPANVKIESHPAELRAAVPER
jgi:beta-galactosidase